MSAAITEKLSAVALQAQSAKHGERSAIFEAACQELAISKQTLYRKLHKLTVRQPRKKRSDKGDYALTLNEAKLISAYMLEHIRKNNKQTKPLPQAVDELRNNGVLVAGRIDTDTGEISYLSYSAITNAMRGFGVHPDQILAPAPVTPLKSVPNQCWQIDASLCVLYKLPDAKGYGIEEVHTTERYKNKLGNFAKIEHKLVQRYLVTDHASCAVFIYYAFGGESTESLCMLVIQAIQQRGQYPFYGIPESIMLDRGSANRSALFKNLCNALGIKLIFAQGARAKGQVEKMHDVVELGLESGLKMATQIRTVEQLNMLAHRWMHWFNGTAIHSRHGKTRYAAWQLIQPGQLKTTDLNTEQLLTLARETPQLRPVTSYLTVNFKGNEYDVSKLPFVSVKDKILVCTCGFIADMAQAILTNEEGRDVFYQLPIKTRESDFGFFTDAADIGTEHKRHADTPAQTVKKELERLAMAAGTDTEAEKNRKAKVAPFAGAINPYKVMESYTPPTYLPKQSTKQDIALPDIEPERLSHVAAAKWLLGRLDDEYQPSMLADLQVRYPNGTTEPELEQVLADIRAGRTVAGKAKLIAI